MTERPKSIIEAEIPTDPSLCKSCGAELKGVFCVECGEKAFKPGEHSIRHFIGDVLNAITFLDSKFFRTMKLMLRKPGRFSYQYINGRRVPYLKPMSMFFIVNLIYFLFPLYNSLNSVLYVQTHWLPHSEIAARMVDNKIKEEGTAYEKFEVQYNQQSTNMAKIFLVLLVVYFSIPLTLFNYSKKLYYFDHLLITLELISLVILFGVVALQWLLYSLYLIGKQIDFNISFILKDDFATPISASVLLILFYLIERQAYSQKIVWAILKSVVLVFSFYWCLQLYRASLFFLTMWTM